MDNKISLNRLERFIPKPDVDGILYVNGSNEFHYSAYNNFNSSGHDNITEGFGVKYDEENQRFIVSPGKKILHEVDGYTFDGKKVEIKHDLPGYKIGRLNGFPPQVITDMIDDDSEEEYTIPEMTSETEPEGKCYASNLTSRAFNAFNSDNDTEYKSEDTDSVVYPITLGYSVEADGNASVRPFYAYIKNGSGLMPSKIILEGSNYKHPYDDGDWETILTITDQPNEAGAGKVHYINTEKYYKAFRLKFPEKIGEQNFITVNHFYIYGSAKGYLKSQRNNYFLVSFDENGILKGYIARSKASVPVFNNRTLYNYYPIDLGEYKIISNIWLDFFSDEVEYYDADLSSDGNKKIVKEGFIEHINSSYKHVIVDYTVENGKVVRYFPREDLPTSYMNRFLIASQDGAIGYKVYSDGWKEQWGNDDNPVFPIAFEHTPCIVKPYNATDITNVGMTSTGDWSVEGY